jgi:hypothetical protein
LLDIILYCSIKNESYFTIEHINFFVCLRVIKTSIFIFLCNKCILI